MFFQIHDFMSDENLVRFKKIIKDLHAMVPVNHKCTITDMVHDLILQLINGQRQIGHYCKSVVEIYGDFLLFRYFGIKSVYEAPHVVNVLVKKL
jgi:hypothetical protein